MLRATEGQILDALYESYPGANQRMPGCINRIRRAGNHKLRTPPGQHQANTSGSLLRQLQVEVYMLPGRCEAYTYLSKPTGSGIHALSNDAPGGSVVR